MSSGLSIPVGVLVACEEVVHPWREHRWRAVSVVVDGPEIMGWRELRRSRDSVLYHAGHHLLELRRTETPDYRVNLANGEPTVYVVLRPAATACSGPPIVVQRVSASPFVIDPINSPGDQILGRVIMPPSLVTRLKAFIDPQEREEPGVAAMM